MLDYSHDALFVMASFAIALIAGFSGLTLTQGASQMSLATRKIVISAAAVILGWGIWSMHFVAMLGLELPVDFFFDPLVTLISALTVILVIGLALIIVHFGQRTRRRIALAGAIVGLGIAAMHYIGMSGIELCAPVYSAGGIGLSVLASILLGMASFFVSYSRRSARNLLLGTAVFGIAVFAVHFTAMAFTGFVETGSAAPVGAPMSKDILAFGVTISAFVLSGSFLLTGATFATKMTGETAAPPPAVPRPAVTAEVEPAQAPVRIPYESDQRTHFIDASAVSALRAEGHYTILYSGASRHFCPWSITEAAQRVPDAIFMRTHRSYLVNLDHVTSFERRKDNGVCYFDGTPALPKAPVARSRLKDVRDRLGL